MRLTFYLLGLSVLKLVCKPVNVGFVQRVMEQLLLSLWMKMPRYGRVHNFFLDIKLNILIILKAIKKRVSMSIPTIKKVSST